MAFYTLASKVEDPLDLLELLEEEDALGTNVLPLDAVRKAGAQLGMSLSTDDLALVFNIYGNTETGGVDYHSMIHAIIENILGEVEEILVACFDIDEVAVAAYFEAFDPHDLGYIPADDFKTALNSTGLNFHKRHSRFLVRYFEHEPGLVSYRRMIEQFERTRKEPQRSEVDHEEDLLSQLQNPLKHYVTNGRVEHIWAEFERGDKTLSGYVDCEQALDTLRALNVVLSPVNVMRLRKRYSKDANATSTTLQYRSLLQDVLLPLQNQLKSPEPSVKSSNGVKLIEKLDDQEVEQAVERILSRAPKGLDIPGLFEQFDREYTETIRRKDFIRCLQWLKLEAADSEPNTADISTTIYHNRLANTFSQRHLQELIQYRDFIRVLAGMLAPDQDYKCKNENENHYKIFTELRGKFRELSLSGIDPEEFLAARGKSYDETVNFERLYQQLDASGIRLSRSNLRTFLCPFLDDQDRIDYKQLVCFVLNTAEEDFKERLAKLVDRFEAYKILRRLVLDRAGGSPERVTRVIIRSCFEEIDLNSNGVIEPQEFVHAFSLLGYRLEKAQAERMILLSFSRSSVPASPEELLVRNEQRHLLWLDLESFVSTLGFHVDAHQVEPHEDYYDCSYEARSSVYSDLLDSSSEVQTTNARFTENLKKAIENNLNSRNGVEDGFLAFEKFDPIFTGAIGEEEFQSALSSAFSLDFDKSECHRLGTRLGLVDDMGDYKYRLLLHKVLPDLSLAKHHHTDETLLMLLRGAVPNDDLRPTMKSSQEVFEFLSTLRSKQGEQAFCKETYTTEVSRLVRALENDDLSIRVDELEESLCLCAGVETVEYLSQLLRRDGILDELEEIDNEGHGYLSEAEFLLVFQELSASDSMAVMRAFQLFIPGPKGERLIDYRRMIRHFSLPKPEKASSKASDSTHDSSEMDKDVGEANDGATPPAWYTFWKVSKEGKDPFFEWKEKKDTQKEVQRILDGLSHTMRCYPQEVRSVGESLVAIELELLRRGVTLTLWSCWLSWCKTGFLVFNSWREEPEDEEVAVRYVHTPKTPQDVESNLVFHRTCKRFWKECEKAVKTALFAYDATDELSFEALRDLGARKLRDVAKRDNESEAIRLNTSKQEKLRTANKAHEFFVRRKDALRVCEPDSSIYRRKVYKHAIDERDLHCQRERLVAKGHILKENFRDADGNIDEARFVLAKNKLERQTQGLSDQANDIVYKQLWKTYKTTGERAAQVMQKLQPPNAIYGKDSRKAWEDVGRCLHVIGEHRFLAEFILWSKGFEDEESCRTTWKKFKTKGSKVNMRRIMLSRRLRVVLSRMISKKKAVLEEITALLKGSNTFPTEKNQKPKQVKTSPISRRDFSGILVRAGVNLRLLDIQQLVRMYPAPLSVKGEFICTDSILLILNGGRPNTNASNTDHVDPISCVEAGLRLAGFHFDIQMLLEETRQVRRHLAYLESILESMEPKTAATSIGELQKPNFEQVLEAKVLAATRIVLTWAHSSTAKETDEIPARYVLEMKHQTTFEEVYRDPPEESTSQNCTHGFTMCNLEPNTRYEFRLQAVYSRGVSAHSSICTWTLRNPFKVAPSKKLSGFQNGLANYAIRWSSVPTDILPVIPFGKENKDFESIKTMNAKNIFQLVHGQTERVVYEGRSPGVELMGLVPGEDHEFKVRASNGSGAFSAFSPKLSFTTKLPPPSAPQIREFARAQRGVRVFWKRYSHGLKSSKVTYIIKARAENGDMKTSRVESLDFTLQPVGYDEIVKFMLRVEIRQVSETAERVVYSSWSEATEFLTPCKPTSQPSIIYRGTTEVFLRWSCESNRVLFFSVQQKEGGTWRAVKKCKDGVALINGLNPDTPYMFRVVSHHQSGIASNPSLPCRVFTKQLTAPSITPLTASLFFTLPCRDLVLGDCILFTEFDRNSQSQVQDLQTIAARIVKFSKRNTILLQIMWLSQMQATKAKTRTGSLIQRTMKDVFTLEKKFGIYRIPWEDESARI